MILERVVRPEDLDEQLTCIACHWTLDHLPATAQSLGLAVAEGQFFSVGNNGVTLDLGMGFSILRSLSARYEILMLSMISRK